MFFKLVLMHSRKQKKKICLDIACFFNCWLLAFVKRILNCEFYPDIGIRVLAEKSLITISLDSKTINIHGLLQELGRNIVREKSPQDPGKWSRLWLFENFHNVLSKNAATENIEAISVCAKRDVVCCEALSKMTRLRMLMLEYMNFSGSLVSLSNELRYLKWDNYPSKCLPSSFQPNQLVHLGLYNSSITQLWKGIKHLPSLRVMDLQYSENLIKTPDFRGLPNLEELNLSFCSRLVRVHPTIGLLRKLACLYLHRCISLTSLPNSILCLGSLQVLGLSGCSNLFNAQPFGKARHLEHLKRPNISETATQGQSKSCLWQKLMLPFHFYSKRQKDSIGFLSPSLSGLSCLRDLDLGFCNLCQIPDAIGRLHCLESLNLEGNNFVTLPSSMKMLSKLTGLAIDHCKQLKSLPELPSTSSTVLPLKRDRFSPCTKVRSVIGTRGPGLYTFNCPKLVDIEGCISIAFSWIIRVCQMLKGSPLSIKIVIPGNQIPRWFGSLSTEVDDNKWIGIAVCLAFIIHEDLNIFGDDKKPYLSCHISFLRASSAAVFWKDLNAAESGHLWLIYCPLEEYNKRPRFVTEEKSKKIEIHFYSSSGHGLRGEILKCGFRRVSKEDLEELNNTMSRNGSSSIQIHDEFGIGSQLL